VGSVTLFGFIFSGISLSYEITLFLMSGLRPALSFISCYLSLSSISTLVNPKVPPKLPAVSVIFK